MTKVNRREFLLGASAGLVALELSIPATHTKINHSLKTISDYISAFGEGAPERLKGKYFVGMGYNDCFKDDPSIYRINWLTGIGKDAIINVDFIGPKFREKKVGACLCFYKKDAEANSKQVYQTKSGLKLEAIAQSSA